MNEKKKILNSLKWGKSVLNLLYHGKDLDPKTPATLIIRHSERDEPERFKDVITADLTKRGLKTAFEFGHNLPANRIYRIYHSIVKRCKETAEEIHKGLQQQGINSQIMGSLNSLFEIKLDRNMFSKFVDKEYKSFLYKWIAGFFDKELIEPSINTVTRITNDIKNHLQISEPDSLNIYVTHDWQVMVSLFHLGGILNTSEMIGYLDGFFIQFDGENQTVYHKKGKSESIKPQWL